MATRKTATTTARKTAAPKAKKKEDFKAKYLEYMAAVEKDPRLSADPILHQLLVDFERMAKVNDDLWADISNRGYFDTNSRGDRIINPSVTAYNKNHSTLMKTASIIEDRCETLDITGGDKAW